MVWPRLGQPRGQIMLLFVAGFVTALALVAGVLYIAFDTLMIDDGAWPAP